jgi:ABC-type glycerol-3-phosphate transport system substrate-binding protein
MDVNAQNFMYRTDIFQELGLSAPATWDDVLDDAAKIKASGKVAYPIGATMKPGYDLSQEFVNMFLGFGGSFTKPDNTPSINSDAGLKTLAMLKRITAYVDPEYLVSESTYVQKQFQQGKIAMSNLWATRAAALDDPKESQVVGKVAMAAAPAAVKGGKSATTLWWDGIVIAKNISDTEADAAFRVALHGLSDTTLKAAPGAVTWLIKGYVPNKYAEGVIASANGGAPAYPSTTVMGLVSSVVGDGVGDFLTGKKTAEQTLADIETAYLAKARAQGLVK